MVLAGKYYSVEGEVGTFSNLCVHIVNHFMNCPWSHLGLSDSKEMEFFNAAYKVKKH